MKKYAKITAAVLSCALVATAFVGCGEKKTSTSDGKTIITKCAHVIIRPEFENPVIARV